MNLQQGLFAIFNGIHFLAVGLNKEKNFIVKISCRNIYSQNIFEKENHFLSFKKFVN